MSTQPRTILITGANSGLGFESAARFAELGADRVILVARSVEKGEAARVQLRERVGRDPFAVLPIDLAELETVDAAIEALRHHGGAIDALLLNAGVAGGAAPRRSPSGIELGFASSLLGHHALTVGLLEAGLLAERARIVIASAEAVGGEMAMMAPSDISAFAEEHFDGDLHAALIAFARAESPYQYTSAPHYSAVKMVAGWWAWALSSRLPKGMAVYAVSPGTTPNTGAVRNQPWLVRNVVMPLMAGPLGRWTGISHSLADAVGRYVEAMAWGTERSGQTWASMSGKTTGPMAQMTQPHLQDRRSVEATWTMLRQLTGRDLTQARRVGASPSSRG
ncbi:MAG: SDR family NAD(P)-dependent oxidoreductase [Myxococcota bacterium]